MAHSSVSNLRIVLLGKSVSENSHVGNFLLGRAAFDSEAPPDVVERVEGRLKDRDVMVINSPQLLQTNISDHQITQTVRECVNLSDPGPHVFIIIMQYNDFTDENMTRVHYVLKKFSEEAIKRTIIFTIDEETFDSHMSHMTKHTATHQLIKECEEEHLQLEKEKSEWHSNIFQSVDMILKENQEDYLTCELYEDVKGTSVEEDQSSSEEGNEESSHHNYVEKAKDSQKGRSGKVDLRGKQKLNLVLFGSDSTLTVSVSKLLQGKKIKLSHQRKKIKECVKKGKIHGYKISLVELPALNRLSKEEVMLQTLRCVFLCHPGVHVFILIVPDGPLTDEDKAEMEKMIRIFDSREHFILLFTSSFSVEGPVMDSIKSSPESQKIIGLCGGRYRVIGLKEPENSRQILDLLDYIKNMKTEPYSLQMYVKAQENRARRELEEQNKKELKRMEDEIKELKQKIQSYGD
ncbi:GTPase IMAP family member 8-like isoform X2 [Ctenopharyngodon idella]|uniref:GTPase IMAP family member 8-like isoform X2 n=1 Tax=Ctenopharyngodon idella TaxID=7959 RepID=UPI0022317FC0|nr:GTPase IMAP family member 8-like isoform X2 [Ctenopharyngodon idella]